MDASELLIPCAVLRWTLTRRSHFAIKFHGAPKVYAYEVMTKHYGGGYIYSRQGMANHKQQSPPLALTAFPCALNVISIEPPMFQKRLIVILKK